MTTTTPPRQTSVPTAPRGPLWALLALGAWLPVSWLVLGYEDASYGAAADVVLGLALLVVVGLQLADDWPPAVLRSLTVWVGLLLVAAPVVVRAGEQGRSAAAYVNTMACGVLVVALGLWTARRAGRERLRD